MIRILLLLFVFSFLSELKASDTLTIRQIYNFDVGDMFDYLNYEVVINQDDHNRLVPPYDTNYFYYQRNIIIGKVIASDSITYIVSNTMYLSDTPYNVQIDTVLISHLDSNLIDTQLILLSTSYPVPFLDISYECNCGLIDTPQNNWYAPNSPWDSVENDVNGALSDGAPIWFFSRFQKGLGMTYYYSENNDGIDPVYFGHFQLIYYSKGNMQAGTPYYNSTLGINDIANISKAKVYPNPTSDQLHLSITSADQYNAQFIITDILGQQLYTMPVTQDESSFDISKLSADIYTWRLVSGNSIIKTGKVIKD